MKDDSTPIYEHGGRMRILTLLTSLLAAAACGGGGGDTTAPSNPPAPSPPGSTSTVTVGNNFFSPGSVTVATGTTVTWQWAADAVTHNVTFDDQVHSSDQHSGTFTRTFTAAGTFPYHCTIHGMQGSVTVSASSSGGGSGNGGSGGGGGGYDY
jgi:plastocyanin